MITRRTLLAGLLASTVAGRLPPRPQAYIVVEDIPLARFGNRILDPAEAIRDMAEKWRMLLPFTTYPGDPLALDFGGED